MKGRKTSEAGRMRDYEQLEIVFPFFSQTFVCFHITIATYIINNVFRSSWLQILSALKKTDFG